MATILKTKSLYYNDVNIIAQPATINSRTEVPKELHRIIVSPMSAIVGETFAIEANRLGLSICLHKFCKPEYQLNIYNKLTNKNNVFVSVGLNDWERVKILAENGVNNFLLDIANGYLPSIQNTVSEIKEIADVKKMMVGNVHTGEGFKNLVDMCAETYIRVGLSGGSCCKTSDSTGVNRGQITEIMEVSNERDHHKNEACNNYIVADGGIKNGNYAAKSFGSGSEFVMMGGYFARAIEAETNISGDGIYYGGASHKQQEKWGGIKRHSEGKEIKIEEELVPLSVLVDDLIGGLSSAISYSKYKTLTDFIGNATFEIKENSLAPKNRK